MYESDAGAPAPTEAGPRRAFLKRAAATGGGLALAGLAAGVSPSGLAGVAAEGSLVIEPPPSPIYRTPSHLPPGYRLIAQQMEQPARPGGTQLAFISWYADPANPLSMKYPLVMQQILAPHPSWFLHAQFDRGQEVGVALPSGRTIVARYAEGWWIRPSQRNGQANSSAPIWDTSNMHSLLFAVDDLWVGLRGSRRAGISREELLRVAAALA